MPLNLIITGVGGQGNVLASQILGRTAVRHGFKVTIGETFGLSQRGGPVMSHICISETKNYSPIIPPNMAHIILGLEPLEGIRIINEFGNPETTYIVNSRPIHPLNVIAGEVEYPDPEWIRDVLAQAGRTLFWLDAAQLAMDLGGPIMLNMIMVGALCALPGFPVNGDQIKEILPEIFSKKAIEANLKAIDVGGGLITENEN